MSERQYIQAFWATTRVGPEIRSNPGRPQGSAWKYVQIRGDHKGRPGNTFKSGATTRVAPTGVIFGHSPLIGLRNAYEWEIRSKAYLQPLPPAARCHPLKSLPFFSQ